MKNVIEKIKRYCAYQDRAESEVRMKLRQYDTTGDDVNRIIEELKQEGFINEIRFTDCFIRGKLNSNKWGREKIKSHLLSKGIPAATIDKQLANIDPKQYKKNLQETIDKWLRTHPDQSATAPALYRHLMSKGYSYQDIKSHTDTI